MRRSVRQFPAQALSARLGRICQAAFRRPPARAALSRSLHASCRHLQPSAAFSLCFRGPFSLEGLCPRQQTAHDDTYFKEFLRRFVQHVLPRGFPRIRYFGWLSNRMRGRILPLCRARLNQARSAECPPSYEAHAMELHALPWAHASRRTALGRPAFLYRTKEFIPLTPHRIWLSTATLACFPARPLLMRLHTRTEPPAPRFPSARLRLKPPLRHSLACLPKQSAAIGYPSSLTSAFSQAIQTP